MKTKQLTADSSARSYSAHDDPLLCRVDGGRLVISIGIDTLAFAAKRANGGPISRRIRIVSKKMFAEDVSAEIQREDEIGGTMLSELLDKAICAARDNGSAGLLWPNTATKPSAESALDVAPSACYSEDSNG